ncbi:glucan endo-1,3-beta-glucosidase-like [Zingiber officinale]|uniref:glucan endo-1,3-beta-glucosidase-like n=1 Tax=Zingiber officinale TaxID=94328 RepID=UPI001C4C138A|nr:glucan endo-1,3-beta-glucosidase-like [Zingiber officinale]
MDKFICVNVICTIVLISLIIVPNRVHGIGVCYGRDGNNLPSPSDVVALYRSNGISNMRIYSPDQDALQALSGSNIQLIVGVPNDNVQSIASDPSAATSWVQSNIVAFPGVAFSYVAVGNELIPENPSLAQFVLPAMQNIQNAINAAGLQSRIRVSTAVSAAVLSQSFPPSQGAFGPDSMRAIVQFLASNGAPLLFNVYPYFSYRDNSAQISLDYALFQSSGVVVQDGQFGYQNLFDAMVDAAYAALEKVGGSNVRIVVSESGWPSAGGFAASIDNARTYNQNLIRHVGQGTPRRSGNAIETYIFAMFNENQKGGDETERNFGLFRPDRQPVYPISFN